MRLAPAYVDMRERLRAVVADRVPEEATVLVVSRGDEELLDLAGREARHFPQGAAGGYAGYYPADSDEAIAHLEQLRQTGAEYVVFPATSLWWLEHYARLQQHLETEFGAIARDDSCLIYGPKVRTA